MGGTSGWCIRRLDRQPAACDPTSAHPTRRVGGETIQIRFEAMDDPHGSTVEAAVDDVRVARPSS